MEALRSDWTAASLTAVSVRSGAERIIAECSLRNGFDHGTIHRTNEPNTMPATTVGGLASQVAAS